MKTITAKNLRDNLDEIVKRVGRGESIKVTYRSRSAFVIQPDYDGKVFEKPGSLSAMQAYVAKVREVNKTSRKSELDSAKSVKELYHNMLDNNPKYKSDHE
ncbi:hypothetical protein COT78_00785 [Candidatus Berkelbacteria bacterium CG10_big_fil_rev_8_21_14_0_10_43_13]|uniref:Antitoxin n=1 Tax=Candidatus Berkelbacteria bacterium CG10_big_fil_rev_8_21_14_0_10_43_13 TaxID=1974514 RepID=A0A2H0W7E1_9BACT|nr:MAG: hypothetical protein COT78_00785 [Candidatus Berkelbacteria bacterium CG10_big_fil_rev_8_21_14_0_10_43_13]